jgi:hypothetical protein
VPHYGGARFTPQSGHQSDIAPRPLVPKADINSRSGDDLLYPPKRTSKLLFDDLVDELLELDWHVKTECFCRLEIDDKLIFGRRLLCQLYS